MNTYFYRKITTSWNLLSHHVTIVFYLPNIILYSRELHVCSTVKNLATIIATATPIDKRRIKRSATTGAWLSTTLPNILNGSDISADEFRDGVRLCLGMQPTALPPRCDGCDERFTIEQ
jgi:hypothetical protein